MKSLFKLVILLLLVCCIAYFTKPSERTVKEKAREYFLAKAEEKAPGSTELPMAGGIARLAADKSLLIRDKILYKEISFRMSGDFKGIGIFGTAFFY